MKILSCCICSYITVLALGCSTDLEAASVPESSWQPVIPSDGSELTARHEAAAVVLEDALYLIGGRGNRPIERFSSRTGQWENLGLAPLELHHFQPVVIGSRIYILGAFSCCYPRERLVSDIHVFDTETTLWTTEGSLPSARVRGSAAAVVRDGKIYLLGGNTQGHDGGAVAWFDEYDPATGVWRQLSDAPNARDHFSAVVIDDQLIAAAGRQTKLPSPAANPVVATDLYDFDTGVWSSAERIPTARGGAVAVAYAQHVVVAGGEINTSSDALDVVEALDIASGRWQTWPAMTTGRHGSGGGVSNGRFFMLSGATTIGGADESRGSESLELPPIRDVAVVEEPEPEVIPEQEPTLFPEESAEQTPEEIPVDTLEEALDVTPEPTPERVPDPAAGDSPAGENSKRKIGSASVFLLSGLSMVTILRRRRVVASPALSV